MRRAVSLGLGVLELATAGLLVFLGCQLPSSGDVARGFQSAEGLAGETVAQVTFLREQLDTVGNPNFGGLREASDGLGNLAQGMEAWANALDPDMIRQLRKGTRELAGFLDEQVGPASRRASTRLKNVTETFRKEALALSQLLREAPPDIKAAKEIHDSLARFGDGLDKVAFLIAPERLQTMREGFKGMETSLDTGAKQIEKLAGYTYPSIEIDGFKVEVEKKPFWPDGEEIAKGMRKGAESMRAANKEFEAQAGNLPQIQRSLDESKKTVRALNDMLGKALGSQKNLEALLKTLPENTARLAAELPLLADDLQKIFDETERLKEISTGLRQAQNLLGSAEKSWPEARQGLLQSAEQLRALKGKIARGIDNPSARLHSQQESLDRLGGNLQQIHAALPGASQAATGLLTGVRWLLGVLAVLVALHSACILLGSRPAKAAGA